MKNLINIKIIFLIILIYISKFVAYEKTETVSLLKVNDYNINSVRFVGNTYMENGIAQLTLLLIEGLKKTNYVLEIGCGALVAGIPIMSYLEPKHYVGIDPNQWLIQSSLWIEQNKKIVDEKQAQFLYNYNFDASSTNITFDYIISHSIISHAAYWQLPLFLENCSKVLKKGGKVIFSLRFTEPNDFGHLGMPKASNDNEWQYPGNSFFDKETVINESMKWFSKVEHNKFYTQIIITSDKSAFHDWIVLTK